VAVVGTIMYKKHANKATTHVPVVSPEFRQA
jgi:hypothetical protein